MRLNYPNNADAISGFSKKLITEAQKNAIIKANNAGKEPPKTTKLGGGIGIHGWYGDWPGSDRQNLTWGCISVQNAQLEDLYGRVGLQTRVVIYP
jgi:lipoprotein-anchoring transpeptidase ErfK/SrfK